MKKMEKLIRQTSNKTNEKKRLKLLEIKEGT